MGKRKRNAKAAKLTANAKAAAREQAAQKLVEAGERLVRKASGDFDFNRVEPSRRCLELVERHCPKRKPANTVSYGVGTRHARLTNLRLAKYTNSPCLREAVRRDFLEDVKSRLHLRRRSNSSAGKVEPMQATAYSSKSFMNLTWFLFLTNPRLDPLGFW